MTPRRREAAAFLLAGLALAVLAWDEVNFAPGAGLDPSWGAALHMSAGSDLTWGRELVFTFGPLGFLKVPALWETGSGTLALLYTIATRVALAGALWWFGRHAFGRVGAVVVAVVVMPLTENPVPVVVFGAALWMLLGDRGRRPWIAFAAATGLVGGLELLGKINIGVLAVALGGVAVLFAPRDRVRLTALYGAAVAAGLLLGWVATGQRLLDLNEYLLNAARVASGYSSAMLFRDPAGTWQYSAALVVVALAAYAVWTAADPLRPRARLGALLLTLVLAFMGFKSGFVRHDPSHVREYFGMMLAAFVIIPYRPDRRAFGLAAVAATLLALLPVTSARLDVLVDPGTRAGHAWEDITLLARPGERERIHDTGRERLRALYSLNGGVVEALAGQTVHVEPYETAVSWAYETGWRPLPVFHSYQAYTAKLDELNARALLGRDAPSRILLGRDPPVDNRVTAWESPAATRAMLCRYQSLVAADPWMVLGRGEDRCGAERPLAVETARWGEPVRVPPPSREGIVLVRVEGVALGLGERVRSALFKAHERRATFGDGVDHPLVPDTVKNGLVLHVPPDIDLPQPFTRAPAPETLAIRREGDPGGTLRYRFSLVPVRR